MIILPSPRRVDFESAQSQDEIRQLILFSIYSVVKFNLIILIQFLSKDVVNLLIY